MKFISANRAKHFKYSVICSLLPAFLFSVSISLSLFPLIQVSNTFLFFQDDRHKKGFQDYTVTLKALLTIYLIFRRRESHPPSIFQKSTLKSLCFYTFFNLLYRSPHPIPKSIDPMIHAYSVLPLLNDIHTEAISVGYKKALKASLQGLYNISC